MKGDFKVVATTDRLAEVYGGKWHYDKNACCFFSKDGQYAARYVLGSCGFDGEYTGQEMLYVYGPDGSVPFGSIFK